MNAALKICHERYDAQLPPDVSESDEVTDWLEHSAERLVCGVDIKWKRRYGPPLVVTFDRFCTVLQGHLNQRQIDSLDPRDSFAIGDARQPERFPGPRRGPAGPATAH
jgi:hypothetical protein